jgi:Xaa-Pro aminopeptidase
MTRIEKLKLKLPENFGAVLVADRYNRRYLTGFESSAGIVVVTPHKAFFIVDFRYFEAAKSAVKDAETLLMTDMYPQLAVILKESGTKELCLENETAIAQMQRIEEKLPETKLICSGVLSDAIKELRMIKDAEEVAAIKAAQAITDAAFKHILGYIKPGVAERELAAEIEYYMRKNGADGTAFPTICISGAKTSMPHGEPDDNTVKHGDFVTMDFGARKDGYCSDMTRTVAVDSVSAEQLRVYNTVLDAHMAAFEAAREGITGQQLDDVARGIINAAGYGNCFGHGLGHSLGLEVHENPRAAAGSNAVLQNGMIMTIEPGIYLAGEYGVRIENMALICENGCENLTKSERELVIV